MKDYNIRKIAITSEIKPTTKQALEYLLDLSELSPKQAAEFVSNFTTSVSMMGLIYDKFKSDYESLYWLHALLKSEDPVKKVIEITHLKKCNKCGEIKSRYMHNLKLADSIACKNYVCDNCGDEVFILKERR